MKILIGMTRSDTIVSGSFKHITQIGTKFRDEGADVIYVLGGNGVAADHLRDLGFTVFCISSLKRDLSLFFDLFSFFRLLFIIIKNRPNICSWHTAKIGALGRITSFLTFKTSYYVPHGVPFVNTPENNGYKKYEQIERMLSKLPSKIIGVCEFDKNEYLRIGVSSNKVIVIPNGMKGITPNPSLYNKREFTHFITAARFEQQKDYKTLADACKHLILVNNSFKLSIYGDGEYESEVKALFKDLPSDNIEFCGVVKNFAEKLAQADIFILSSFWEGLPRSMIEAMACKKPTICSDVGGCSELVQDNVTGFLIPIRDSVSMANKMAVYVDDRSTVLKHGKAAFNTYQSKYTLERMLGQYCVEYGVTCSQNETHQS